MFKSQPLQPRYMNRHEIEKLHCVDDRARKRAECGGLFPRRIKLAPHIVVWLRSEVAEWYDNPNSWVDRHRAMDARRQSGAAA
jgi:Prophage CP4-57 regulatory protein (AlpA)